jgi:hypothetical protein
MFRAKHFAMPKIVAESIAESLFHCRTRCRILCFAESIAEQIAEPIAEYLFIAESFKKCFARNNLLKNWHFFNKMFRAKQFIYD